MRETEFVEDRSVLARSVAPPDAVVRYGDLDAQIADVRIGRNQPQVRPLAILIHGGYWRPQFDRTHTGPMCAAIAAAGWTVAAIEYRRVPGDPDATLDDVARALEKVPAMIREHSGQVVVLGHSAGGHLALWSAAKCTSPRVGTLALGPAADLQWGEAHGVGNGAVRAFLGVPVDRRPDVDPCQLPTPSTRVTIVHGIQDEIAPLAMAENYLARHPSTRLVRLDRCGHFAVIDPANAHWQRVLAELAALAPRR